MIQTQVKENSMVTQNSKKQQSEFTVQPQAAEVIKNSSREELRMMAKQEEKTTEYYSAAYVAKFKARSAAFTRTTVDGQVTAEDRKVIQEIQEYLKTTPVIEVDRQLCQGESNDVYACRLWVTKKYARLAHMFHASLGKITKKFEKPDMFVVDVPEYPGERRILVDPDACVTYVLGSDYYGEIKKAFLRMVMYDGKQKGGLGLHAGSKEVWAKNVKTGEIDRSGILFFGLSGTGKTSLTCHDFNLDTDAGEQVRVRQDDVVILQNNGSAKGTEIEGFYIKTEGLNPVDQKALYQAAVCKEAIFENVWVDDAGNVDFDNCEISQNGRAVVPVSKVINTDGDIDMPLANKIFFITRNPLSPPISKLSQEQAAVAFMLGESIKTSAADPNAKGEAVREVGTNPFIVGSKDEEGNRFYEILKANPRIECYLLNTGKFGSHEKSEKIKILDTIAMLTAVCRNAVEWAKDEILDVEIPVNVEGIDMNRFSAENFWDKETFKTALKELREARKAWLDQFPALQSKITDALY
ncbi:MAG TPA: phosphoenolpyruvate carboxykinase [Oligoflexia bacterium]|nr:phosphoenolpyruvate carboxykinase [Oligoflexia bacterium]HMR25591.1 phosphoenolpyruvate carboxykinase [Oligoflexia bacterium]